MHRKVAFSRKFIVALILHRGSLPLIPRHKEDTAHVDFIRMTIANSSAAAMGRAITPHLPLIWRFALSLARRRDVADDLVQATCLRAMEKHAQFDGEGRLEAWCLTICRSIWLNELRAQSVRAAQAIDTVPEAELRSIVPSQEADFCASQVISEMMKLPEPQREVVMLVYVEGFRYAEAAGALGVPIGTVMSRLSAARQKLKWMQDSAESKAR